MNLSYYIANRISKSSTGGYSGTIIKIAIASIAMSVAIMILSVSVIYGFKQEISQKIFGFWGNIHITDTRISRTFELTPIYNSKALKDSIATIGALEYNAAKRGEKVRMRETQGGVRSIHPFITLPAIMQKDDQLDGVILKGVDQDYSWEEFNRYLIRGRFPELRQDTSSRDILISEQTSLRLKLDTGDKLMINLVKDRNSVKRIFTVCGIYKTGLEIYDKRFAFIDMKILQKILDWEENQVGGFEVFIEHFEDAIPMADYIYEEILPPHMYAETIQEKFRSEFEWLELQDINEALILLLMIIVAIINMSTAILILILERSKMIGVLKALGMKDWAIRKIFVYNALWIMVSALIIGNVVGLCIAVVQKYTGILKLDEENYYLSEVPVMFDISSILYVNIGTVLVTLVVMVIPSYLVTKISPIKILRFE